MRQSLQEEFIQDGTDSHTKHNVPDANSAHHFAENTSLTEPLIASRAVSAESDARNPQKSSIRFNPSWRAHVRL